MGVYLDIDLDFLVSPVRQKSINNVRVYKNDKCKISDVDEFIKALNTKGLLNPKDKRFFTSHRKSYTYWWINKLMDMTLIHIDAHSDLYRVKNKALTLLCDSDMGCDDYIWYAIRDGFISKIYWVIPEGLYNLRETDLAKRFISKDMLKNYSYEDNMLKIDFEVETRLGKREIKYSICTLKALPCFDRIDFMTVATSPEFIPQDADMDIYKALKLLGASSEDIERISKMHKDMPSDSENSGVSA